MEEEELDEEEVREEPTAAEIVQAGIAQGHIEMESVPINLRELDEAEEQLIQKFARDGCHCTLGANQSSCCFTITVDHYRSVRCQMMDLTHDELDLVVMGQVMVGCYIGEDRGWERGKTYTVFHHQGARICKKTFLFLH